jgi:predicted Ser/Thr protein kinase
MSQRETIAEQLFGEALDLPREQRAAFLDRECAGKPAVRRMVEDLLDENDRLSGFLSAPAYGSAQATATASPEMAAGTRLSERYLIVERLGSGGMGVVSRARDEKLEREVAIKMLQPGVLTGEEARSRFRREARALAKLNHAHIAAVYDVGEQDGADYIVMELVEGESLAAKLRAGPMPVKEATAIALQVAEALEEAHEHGVIHRDLKPANVMMTAKGQAKVLDFGLAKMLALGTDSTLSLAETQGLLGTPLYMSPEQALGKSVDARTDLWSLGVVYYQCLTGRPPFQGDSSIGVLHAITSEPYAAVRSVRAAAGGANCGASAGEGLWAAVSASVGCGDGSEAADAGSGTGWVGSEGGGGSVAEWHATRGCSAGSCGAGGGAGDCVSDAADGAASAGDRDYAADARWYAEAGRWIGPTDGYAHRRAARVFPAAGSFAGRGYAGVDGRRRGGEGEASLSDGWAGRPVGGEVGAAVSGTAV